MLFAGTPVYAQPPGTVVAGNYHNTSMTAGFFASAAAGSLTVNAISGTSDADPKGAPGTTTKTTRVFVDAFGTSFSGNGCYDIAPSDFTFSISAATLHTTITDSTGTCGGPPGSIPTPFTLGVTWNGTGPISSSQNGSHLKCGAYGLDTTVSTTINAANAVATFLPLFTDRFTGQSQLLRTDDEVLHAHGVSPDLCQPVGGIPGGAGPPPAGDYRSASINAGIFFFNDTGTSVGIFVTKLTQTSEPTGAAATTTTEFDVRINVFGGGTFGFGCFNLTPADFSSNGVLGATLNMTIKADTPTCQQSGPPVGLPLPLTVNVAWSGSGPVATTRSRASFSCLTYRNDGESLDSTNLANVTATLTPLLAAPLTSNQGSLATDTTQLDAQGAQQPACHL
jgi:hypothetical protein